MQFCIKSLKRNCG